MRFGLFLCIYSFDKFGNSAADLLPWGANFFCAHIALPQTAKYTPKAQPRSAIKDGGKEFSQQTKAGAKKNFGISAEVFCVVFFELF